jgi:hypothetical protein
VRPRISFGGLTAVLAVVGALSAPQISRADNPSAPSPEAVAFFDEGRRLMAAEDYAGAIPKLEQSLKATRTVGALLNLGRCYEQVGRIASAWATYRAGASLARELHDAREADGNRFAEAVRGKVSTLTIDAHAVDGVTGLEMTLDGVALGAAARGEAVPIDAGMHVVEASAPHKKKATTSVEVGKDGARATLAIPPLEDAPDSTQAPGSVLEQPSSTQRTVGLALGIGGLALTAAGAATGAMAISKHNQATASCSTYPDHCSSTGAADAPNHDSQTFATLSTVGFIGGGVLIAAGVVLFLSAPSAAPSTGTFHVAPWIGSRGGGAAAEVAW